MHLSVRLSTYSRAVSAGGHTGAGTGFDPPVGVEAKQMYETPDLTMALTRLLTGRGKTVHHVQINHPGDPEGHWDGLMVDTSAAVASAGTISTAAANGSKVMATQKPEVVARYATLGYQKADAQHWARPREPRLSRETRSMACMAYLSSLASEPVTLIEALTVNPAVPAHSTEPARAIALHLWWKERLRDGYSHDQARILLSLILPIGLAGECAFDQEGHPYLTTHFG